MAEMDAKLALQRIAQVRRDLEMTLLVLMEDQEECQTTIMTTQIIHASVKTSVKDYLINHIPPEKKLSLLASVKSS
jgi:hypothetical protein